MKESKLYRLLKEIEYGTKINVGVVFFGEYGNGELELPNSHMIHRSPVCESFKSREGGYTICFRTRQEAFLRARSSGMPFFSVCPRGIYEYTHPIMLDNECIGIIFIGNIMPPPPDADKIKSELGKDARLACEMENFTGEEHLRECAGVIESYIMYIIKNGEHIGNLKSSTIIKNIKRYASENFSGDVTLSDIAEVFHYNAQYLGRLFNNSEGMSFAEYINGEKIKKAASMLRTSERAVTEIATISGFNSVSYFNRVFKKKYGLSPSEYRKEG